MKFYLFIFSIIFIFSSSLSFGGDQLGGTLSASINTNYQHVYFSPQYMTFSEKDEAYGIAVTGEYFFHTNEGYETVEIAALLVNPFLRYYYNVSENIDFFCHLYAGAGINIGSSDVKYLLLDIGVKPGFSIGLSESLKLEAGIGIFDFCFYHNLNKKHSYYEFDLTLNSFSLGLMFKL